MKFRKKPVVIEAFQYWPDSNGNCVVPDWMKKDPLNLSSDLYRDGKPRYQIQTLEGTLHAEPGDWIIKGIKGEIYPCKPEIFEDTYEKVDEDEKPAGLG